MVAISDTLVETKKCGIYPFLGGWVRGALPGLYPRARFCCGLTSPDRLRTEVKRKARRDGHADALLTRSPGIVFPQLAPKPSAAVKKVYPGKEHHFLESDLSGKKADLPSDIKYFHNCTVLDDSATPAPARPLPGAQKDRSLSGNEEARRRIS